MGVDPTEYAKRKADYVVVSEEAFSFFDPALTALAGVALTPVRSTYLEVGQPV